jgi:hypothetical protein
VIVAKRRGNTTSEPTAKIIIVGLSAKKFYLITSKIMELPFYMSDIAKFMACFGLNASDLADYLLEDEEVYS